VSSTLTLFVTMCSPTVTYTCSAAELHTIQVIMGYFPLCLKHVINSTYFENVLYVEVFGSGILCCVSGWQVPQNMELYCCMVEYAW